MTGFENAGGFQMWVVFALIVGGLAFYVRERGSMELTSIGIVCFLLVFFHFYPIVDSDGVARVTPTRILNGFANPALMAVLALLVVGHGMVRTGVLDRGANLLLSVTRGHGGIVGSLIVLLIVAIIISAFLNNIPVVVIFIPIIQTLATRFNRPASKYLIPLSYAAVLGGMTTLIGSSTNLLVNSALIEMKQKPFEFFDFTAPGSVMVAFGLLYVVFIAPRLLPDRSSDVTTAGEGGGKQFIAHMTVSDDSPLIGKAAIGGLFAGLPNKTLRMVQRDDEVLFPPFEDYVAASGDVLVVAATRQALTETLSNQPDALHPDLGAADDAAGSGLEENRWKGDEQFLAEVMVAPGSGMIGLTLPQIGFRYKTHCIVVGIQRRSRMIRSRLTEIRLEAGDVLLVQGQNNDISLLRKHRDVVLLEWSTEELPALKRAKRAGIIFLAVISSAAFGVVPIVVSALCGAAAMVIVGVLNVRQAFQAVDPKIVTTIAAALALGVALQETGGASYLAGKMLASVEGASPSVVLSLFFLLVAGLSNLISTKTAAVLFTPIAVDIAHQLGVPSVPFAVAVIFAANCSFASPLGYQTNLLVMGPGHYRFADFFRAGLPLIILLWLVFSLFAPWYYDL